MSIQDRFTARPGAVRRVVALVVTIPVVLGASAIAAPPAPQAPPESDAVVFTPTASDLARGPIDHAPADAVQTDATVAPGMARDAGDVIDIAFAYPAALLSQNDIGGLEGLREKFTVAIREMNRAFANSGVNARLRYVGDRQVAHPTTKDTATMLTQLQQPGDGIYDEALQLREETHADLVSLWLSSSVPLGDACGRANLGGTSPEWDPDYSAFSVLFYTDCVDDFRVFEHEVGHNFSGDHDIRASAPAIGGKPYARGFTSPANEFITVMAYYDHCTTAGKNCTRIPYFSSPTGTNGAGEPVGNANTDNARAVAEQAPLIANYRQSQIYPATPVITGVPNRGKTLSATAPGWAPGNVVFSYQWTADGALIEGESKSTLKLGKAQVGKAIAVTVTGSAPYYDSVVAASAATGPIGKRLFKKTSRPKLKGAPRVGRLLRAVPGTWKPAKKVGYRFTWYRNGDRIKGIKGRTYRVKSKDRGKKISVKVTGKRRGYESESRTSRKVKVRR